MDRRRANGSAMDSARIGDGSGDGATARATTRATVRQGVNGSAHGFGTIWRWIRSASAGWRDGSWPIRMDRCSGGAVGHGFGRIRTAPATVRNGSGKDPMAAGKGRAWIRKGSTARCMVRRRVCTDREWIGSVGDGSGMVRGWIWTDLEWFRHGSGMVR